MDGRKRAITHGSTKGNDDAAYPKRFREMDFNQPGLRSKPKPCTKIFSTGGCPFGEGCHFLHNVPGGIAAVSQMTNLGRLGVAPARNPMPLPTTPSGLPSSAPKMRMCNKYNTPVGCKFGGRCHFAHGEWELAKPFVPVNMEYPQPTALAAATGFGASATAKISVDASLSGAIIGKGGMNRKQICRITGVKLAIREHESDPNLRNIELEGTFDQINHASSMVRELIVNVSSTAPMSAKTPVVGVPGALGSNFKTKICDNFKRGSCIYGGRCHFAHGTSELRKPAA